VRGRVNHLENGPPVGYPVQFRVYGQDNAKVRAIGQQVADIMREEPHVRQVNQDWGERIKRVQVDVDQDKARALGISSGQIKEALEASLSGTPITQYREQDQGIDVVSRLVAAERTDLNNRYGAQGQTGNLAPWIAASNTRTATIGLQLNIPLYAGGGLDSRERESVARKSQAEQEVAAARRDVRLKVQDGFLSVKTGVSRVAALEQSLTSARSRRRRLAGTLAPARNPTCWTRSSACSPLSLTWSRHAWITCLAVCALPPRRGN